MLYYVFNKKSIRKPFKDQLILLNQLSPINAKFRGTKYLLYKLTGKTLFFSYIIMKLRKFHYNTQLCII